MNKKELYIIKKIYADCLKLKNQKQINEYGKGMLDLCTFLLSIKKENYEKFIRELRSNLRD